MDFLSQPRSRSDYVHALEEERDKIEVFQRELPFCLQLVTQAIKSVKEVMNEDGDDDDDDDGGRPVVKEFIPLKPTSSSSPEAKKKKGSPADEMPDWLRSVQLWNLQDPETAAAAADLMEGRPKKPISENAKRINGGAFHSFEKGVAAAVVTNSNTGEKGDGAAGGQEKDKEGQPHRTHRKSKARRNWSPELHCRFLHALEQLGGSQVATPKQIRELMKGDGLTNDEVKSHLQKYRLHNRRESLAVQSSSAPSPPVRQFVVLGGIWVPPLDSGVRSLAAEVYTPSATTLPPAHPMRLQQHQQQQQQQEKLLKLGCSGDADVEVSPTNSCSSSQTTTASLGS